MKFNAKKVALACGTGVAVMFASTQAFARSETCHATQQKEIASLFDRWNTALASGDPAKVDANYAPDAVLLPTLSDEVRTTSKAREDYFTHFLEHKPTGKIDFREIKIGCNTAIDTGNYTFTFDDGSKVAARYTFTYSWHHGKWLITTHHSSQMPKAN
ncbi:SgcJ/EcaC family oxidoreductase [Pandoraea sp. NPDC087047]|uniref:SgcJ/EcaC family oxidoreductase n=1 Tax=Pandoraea sp. NPDC087047 TaxID=3364390 RepID=UPI003811BA8F